MAITAVLLHQDNLFHTTLEMGQEITFGSHKKDDVRVEDFSPEQISIKWKPNGIAVKAQKAYGFEKESLPLDSIIMLHSASKTALYFSSMTSQSPQTITLPYHCILKFGRSADNDVTIKLPFVSASHFTLKNEGGIVRIEDNGSTNGLFVNGKKVTIARLRSGDIISILSVQIQLLNGELHFYNVGNMLSIHLKSEDLSGSGQMEIVGGMIRYHRSPRMQSRLPDKDIILAPAPTKGQRYTPSRGMFSSIAGSGAMFAASMLTTAASPALLAARAASMVSPITSIASSKSSNKSGKKKAEQYEQMRREKYSAYIADQKAHIESVAKVQRDILNSENPTPKECVDILFGMRRNLWERMPADRDFLDIRIGMGYEDLCVHVKCRTDANGFQMENDETRELSAQIIEETRIVDNVPTRLRLLQNTTVGLIGDRQKALALTRNLVMELTTTHCFEDVRIVGIFDESERSFWEPLKWLPHVWDENRQFRFLAFNKEDAHNLCEVMNDTLKARKAELSDRSYRSGVIPRPYYIFLLGSKDLVEKEELIGNLLTNNPEMGVSTLFLFNDMYLLPHDCKYIIDLNNGPCAYDRNEANRRVYFTADPPTDDVQFDGFARRMSAVELVGFAKQMGLPNGITFLEGFGAKTVEQLHVIEQWKMAKPSKSLAAPVGVLGGNKTLSLDIHEKKHGPHGLVAGTIGSGKSEFLLTYILSMCLTYSPNDVNFVVIDYKGGGMARQVEHLPHVVGTLTNLNANIERALVSLRCEINRREQIFNTCGLTGKVEIYQYQEAYQAGKVSKPLPHLVIVVDEFRELKKEKSEYMTELVSIALLGRALGMHLILATQKPGGVVDDQIQSNSRFRVCLKVQDVNDSREMIKRPDAAKLTQAGRAYIRVGEDEYFDLFQSYWSGAPYFGATAEQEDVGNQVRIVDTIGRRIKTIADEKTRFKSDLDELTAITRYICSAAKEAGIEPLPGPWLPELPERLTLRELAVPGGFDGSEWRKSPKWLTVPIGLFDCPKAQAQGVQWLDLAADGHTGIYGAPGTGKTSLLKEIVLALGIYYTPQDINLYILDCGGWSMSVFAGMPHVGSVALDQEEEKFLKFEKLILDEFDRRKKMFLKNAVSSLSAYRESVSADMPAIIIAIDNIVAVFDLYPDLENLFVTIAGQGATYGIYLIYTANSTTGVRYKVLQNIRSAIAFELTDKGDYAMLVGRPESGLPKTIGRAYFKGNPPMEFQAALYSDGGSDRDMTQNLKALLSSMNGAWHGDRPQPIPVMPETVTAGQLADEYTVRDNIPFGICYDDIRPALLDLSERYCMLLSGPMKSGKSRMLSDTVSMILSRFPQTKCFIFDSGSGALSGLRETAHRYATVQDEETVALMLAELVEHLNQRKKAQNGARQVAGDAFDENIFIADYEMLCIVVDDLKEFVDAVTDESKNSMERICRLAQGLGVIVLTAGRMADMEKYNEIESLTRAIVGNQNGLATGGTPSQLAFFQNNLKYADKEQEAGEGNGWLFTGGKCRKVKLPL